MIISNELIELIERDNENYFLSILKNLTNNDIFLLLKYLTEIDNYKYFVLVINNYKITYDNTYAYLNNCDNIKYFSFVFNKIKLRKNDLDVILFYALNNQNYQISIFLIEHGCNYNLINIFDGEFKKNLINIIRIKKLKQLL